MEIKTCPGCGSRQISSTGNKGAAISVEIKELVVSQPEYEIQLCLNCGLYYKSHLCDELSLRDYYRHANFSRYEYEKLWPTERVLLRELSKLPTRSKILDYGCSTGRLLSRLTGQYECFGVEVNSAAAAIAVSKGIQIISEADLLDSKNYEFDAILLCDVFEHLQKPSEVLGSLIKVLKPAGILILCTGNADVEACQRDIANFWYFRSIEHLCMFSKKYANFLVSQLKIELKLWIETCHYDFNWYEHTLQHIRNFAYWQFHGKETFLLKTILRKIPFLKRAELWQSPPYFACTKDHVVAIFQKL